MRKAEFRKRVEDIAKPVRYLISIVPEDKYGWSPRDNMFDLGRLVGHLVWSMGDFKKVIENEQMVVTPDFETLPKEKALETFDEYITGSLGALDTLTDEDFYKPVETPWGFKGNMIELLMLLCDHVIHHKMQLYIYLKLLGYDLGSGHLYYGEELS